MRETVGGPVDEKDFWLLAQHLIKLHGHQAELDVAFRAERARLSGDKTGHDIWRVVMSKVRELQRQPLPGERH
jgi:hypothetical protein